jgi:nucleoside-diphosphate-sugar epimerase
VGTTIEATARSSNDGEDNGLTPTAGPVVAVTGAGTELGRRVTAALASALGARVVPVEHSAGAETTLPSGVTVLVHLAPGDHDTLARRRASALAGTPELLQAATDAGVLQVVLLSSAMTYGAWPNNPVPLTEDSVLRPDQRFVFARQLAVVEQLVDEWRRSEPARAVAVLRPVPAMAVSGTTRLVRALAAGLGARAGEDDAPAQFLHVDDLVAAVVLAVERRLDGVYNVAPDGAIDGPSLRALSGAPPRVRLPGPVVDVLASLRWRFQRGPIPPGLRPYIRWPWLVANDRLRAEGWRPTVTNEQAFVEGTEARWWTMLSPKRKQELALVGMVLGLLGLAAAAVVSGRRWRRRAARRAQVA